MDLMESIKLVVNIKTAKVLGIKIPQSIMIRTDECNTVRLAVRAEQVEAHSPFDRLRANELKRTVLPMR